MEPEEQSLTEPKDRPVLDELFSFLRNPSPEAFDTAAGYFLRCLLPIVEAFPLEVFEYAKRKDFLTLMVKKMSNQSIATALLSLVLLEKATLKECIEYGDSFVDSRTIVMSKLIEILFNLTAPHEVWSNIAFVLGQIFIRAESMLSGKEIISKVLSGNALDVLFKGVVTNKPNSDSIITVLVTLLGSWEVSSQNVEEMEEENSGSFEEGNASYSRNKENQKIHEVFVKFLPGIIGCVLQEPEKPKTIQTQFSEGIKPFGYHRMRCLSLIKAGIQRFPSVQVAKVLMERNFHLSLIKLTIAYPWNSILHSDILTIFEVLIEQTPEIVRGKVIKPSFWEEPGLFRFDQKGFGKWPRRANCGLVRERTQPERVRQEVQRLYLVWLMESRSKNQHNHVFPHSTF